MGSEMGTYELSPNLEPIDFFFWGYVKEVFSTECRTDQV